MSCELIMTVEEMQDRKAWLEMRKTGIGGSDAAVVLGISKWKSPWDLWLEKTGQVEIEDFSNDYIEAGNRLEPVIADWFCDKTGKKVRRCGMLRSKEYPWMLADVDRLIVGENAILECKTAAQWKGEEWSEDNLPDAYYLQVQHYLAVGGYDKAYIAVLIGGHKFVWKEIPRNDDDIAVIIEKEEQFWKKNVIEKALPDADGSTACAKAISLYYEGGGTEAVELDGEYDLLCRDLKALKEDVKKLELAIATKENKLKIALGNGEFGRSAKYNVYFKTKNRTAFNSKQFEKDYPELYEKYVKNTSYRSLHINVSKARMDD
jgi:putative phage-type endonuclease